MNILRDHAARQRLGNVFLGIALISVVMLPRLLNLDTFIGPDEKALWGWGNKFALTLSQGDWRETLIGDGYPAVTLMWVNTVGVGLKWLWLHVQGAGLPFVEVIGLDRPLELYAERRLFLVLCNGLQILAAYPLLRRVWGKRVATLSVGLMAIEPLYLAFGRMIRADALLSGFMLLSILSTLVFLKTDDHRYNWLAGAMGGLAALSKFSGGITALIAIAIYTAVAWHRTRRAVDLQRRPARAGRRPTRAGLHPGDFSVRASGESQPGPTRRGGQSGLRWLVSAVLGWGVPAAVLFFGLWPAWWVRPADTFNLLWGKVVYHAVEATTQRASTYFWGRVHPFGPGPWFYPVLAALRLTPWLLLGGLAAVGCWLWRAVRPRSAAVDWSVLAICFYVAAYWLAITIPGQKIDRYFVPIIPGLAVLTAIEMVAVAQWLKRRLSPRLSSSILPRFAAIGIGLLMIGHVGLYHPLYSTYFDPLIGNPAFWQWALPAGNGEGVDAALKHLSALPGAADSTVVCGTNFPRCQPFFSGGLWHQEDLRSARWFEADYALWHIDEQQSGIFPAGVLAYLRRQTEIYVARYHGLDYTWLYSVPRPSFVTGGSKLEGVAILFGYDMEGKSLAALSPGGRLPLHLYWQNEGQAAQQRFWWRVVDGEGYIWSEAVAQPLPEFEDDAAQEGAVVEGEVPLSLPPDMPPGRYYLKAGFADAAGDVGQFALPAEGSLLTVSGPSVGASQPTHTLDNPLTPDLRLRGYDLSSAEGIPGEALWMTLYWQAVNQIQHDYIITLRLLDETGQDVASWSGRPFYNTFPTQRWPADANVRDPWRILLPSDLTAGQYQLKLSLLDASDSSQQAQANLGTLKVVARRVSFEVPPMQFQANYAFGDIAVLLGYDLLGDLLPDSAHMRVTLYWKALRATDQPYKVNVRLVDANGLILAEQESQPSGGAVPTTEWQAGEIVTDLHEIDVAGREAVSVNLEVRLLDADRNSIPTQNGAEALVVSDVQQKAIWRMPTQ
jgi:hypothetical protein